MSLSYPLMLELVLEGWTLLMSLGLGYNSIS